VVLKLQVFNNKNSCILCTETVSKYQQGVLKFSAELTVFEQIQALIIVMQFNVPCQKRSPFWSMADNSSMG